MCRPQILHLLFVSISLLASSAVGQNLTSVASVYGEKWYAGDKLLVMQLAESRLQKNPSDLASQLVLLDYAISFMDTNSLESLIPMIRRTAANIKSPNFLQKKKLLDLSLESLDAFLPSVTEQMRASEAYKGALPRKPLSVLPIIEALETDGLVAKLSDEEKSFIRTKASPGTPNNANTEDYQKLRSLPLTELQKAFPAPRMPSRENDQKEINATSATCEPISSIPWSIVVVLIVASAGLLWLLFKRRS